MFIKQKHNTIVSFGCWNQTHLKEGPSPRVINIMKKLEKVDNDIVLVSGDNYYPVKKTVDKESLKIVNLEQLKQGFKMLKDATEKTQVFMNFGNHDVVSNDRVNVSENNQERNGECVIMKTELAGNSDNFHVGMSHKILYGDHTLILMIDTSIYSLVHKIYVISKRPFVCCDFFSKCIKFIEQCNEFCFCANKNTKAVIYKSFIKCRTFYVFCFTNSL